MFVPLLKLELQVGFDTDTKTFKALADEKVGPLPDAQQSLDVDPLKAIGAISGGLKGDVLKLLGHGG